MSLYRRRKKTGSSIIEMGAGIFAFAIATLLVLNTAALVFGQAVLDEATRDAARAASDIEGDTYAQCVANATAAAKTALRAHLPVGNLMLNNLKLTALQYQDYSFTYIDQQRTVASTTGTGAPIANAMNPIPYVTVSTSIEATIPAPILFGQLNFNNGQRTMQFQETLTFPIVNQRITTHRTLFDNVQRAVSHTINNKRPCPAFCGIKGPSGPSGPPLANQAPRAG